MNKLKNLVILLLVLSLIWALLAKNCRPVKPTIITKIDTVVVQDKLADQKITAQDEIIRAQEAANASTLAKLNVSDKNLRIANRTATDLANELAEAKMRHDTVLYQAVCDSLGNAAVQWELDYRHISDSARWAFRQLDGIVKHKDTIISVQEQSRARLLSALNAVKSSLQPRRKLFIGAEGYSTKIAFQSLQAGAIYVDKKENAFGLSAGFTLAGDAVLGIKYYHIISLKK